MRPSKFFRQPAARRPALLTAGALFAAGAFLAGAAQAQVPASQAPSLVWEETFDNPAMSALLPMPLEADGASIYPNLTVGYTGVYGETYTADPDWLPRYSIAAATNAGCDGWVLNQGSPQPTTDNPACNDGGGRYVVYNPQNSGAGGNAWLYVTRMAGVLGMAQGAAAITNANNVVASLTMPNGNARENGSLQLGIPNVSTATNPVTPVPGHFYRASALFGAVHCSVDLGISGGASGWVDPWEGVYLVVNGVSPDLATLPTTSTVCPASVTGTGGSRDYTPPSSPLTFPVENFYPYQDLGAAATHAGNVFVARVSSPVYQVPTSGPLPTLGMEIHNNQSAFTANDVAFDAPMIEDVTPTLYKSFNPSQPESSLDGSIPVNGTGTLTFIIVNTSDLLEKTGWSFSDHLPNFVNIAAIPNVQTDCASGTGAVSVIPSGWQITVTNGSIAAGVASCRISVDVTSASPGAYPDYLSGSGAGTVTTTLIPASNNPATLYVNQLTLNKTATTTDGLGGATKPAITKAGDVINYTFTLQFRVGANTQVNSLSFDDVAGVGFSGSSALSIGDCTFPGAAGAPLALPLAAPITVTDLQTVVCHATYTVTQGDIDAAIAAGGTTPKISNTASVAVETYPSDDAPAPGDPGNGTGTALTSTSPEADSPITPNPLLTISKTASPTIMGAEGETITYTIVLTNTGNETLHGLSLDDSFGGHGTPPAISDHCTVPPPVGGTAALGDITLAPGQATTCTANYTVVAADLTGPSMANTANATGKNPANNDVDTSTPGTATVLLSDMTLSKTAAITDGPGGTPKTTITKAGDVITYTFKLTNAGPAGSGELLLRTLSWSDPQPPVAGIGFSGSSALSIGSCSIGGTAVAPWPPTDNTSLDIGQVLTCTATYTVTQPDIDAAINAGTANITNKAEVTVMSYPPGDAPDPGQPDNGLGVQLTADSDVNTATSTITASPALTISKSASPTIMGAEGDVITYTITVSNTGNETLHGLSLADNFTTGGTGAMTPTAIDTHCQLNAAGAVAALSTFTLAPGASVTCTADYSVAAADITAGKVTNTASATGKNPANNDVDTSTSGTATVLLSDITLTKTAAVNGTLGAPVTRAGDIITYTFTLTNAGSDESGELRLSTLSWNDPTPPVSGIGFSGSSALTIGSCTVDSSATLPTALAPGKSLICTATYTVTQGDIDAGLAGAGTITNKAQVTGTAYPIGDTPTSGPDTSEGVTVTADSDVNTATSTITATASLTISKTASPTIMGAVGDVIAYTITVTNTGQQTLHGITLTDNFGGRVMTPAIDSNCQLNAAGTTGALSSFSPAPGQSITCTANYTVVGADITAGSMTNTANATGKDNTNTDVTTSTPGTATVRTTQIALSKTAAVTDSLGGAKTTVTKAGDVITYTFTVTISGSGELRLSTLAWNDPAPPVAGIGFTGSSALSIGGCTVGGSATLPNALTIGQSLICTATYTVTQADIDNAIAGAGTLSNKASVTGTSYPSGQTPAAGLPDTAAGVSLTADSDVTTATTTVTADPALTISKTASPTTMHAAGDVITYTIVLTNTGNETLDTLALTDTFGGHGTIPAIDGNCTPPGGGAVVALGAITLAPGEATTCTADYTVVAADLGATLKNTASATGLSLLVRSNVATLSSLASVSPVSAGGSSPAAIPALDARALALLALLLCGLAWRARRGPRSEAKS